LTGQGPSSLYGQAKGRVAARRRGSRANDYLISSDMPRNRGLILLALVSASLVPRPSLAGFPRPSASAAAPPPAARHAEVALHRCPNGGIQPEAAIDSRGVLHPLYFPGEPAGGDLFYVRSTDFGATFSPAVRVNSQPGSAIATGTIRGGQLA